MGMSLVNWSLKSVTSLRAVWIALVATESKHHTVQLHVCVRSVLGLSTSTVQILQLDLPLGEYTVQYSMEVDGVIVYTGTTQFSISMSLDDSNMESSNA
jgi:hypothetical protein